MGVQLADVVPLRCAINWISLGVSVRLRFGDFEFETGARQLLRGATEVHLSPKAFGLLVTLLARRPRAVSKQELQDVLWPSTFVAESNLPALVNELRTALGDNAAHPRFVRTVPRFGYAFSGEVSEAPETPPSSTTRADGLSYWLILENSRFELPEGETVVGRDPNANVWIDLPTMSRRHARIVISGQQARLEDLSSKNGTCLRGRPIRGPEQLHDRDAILFGSVQVTFRAWQSSAEIDTRTS